MLRHEMRIDHPTISQIPSGDTLGINARVVSAEVPLHSIPGAIRSELVQKGAVNGVVTNRVTSAEQVSVQEIRVGSDVMRLNPPLSLREGEQITLRLDADAGTVKIERSAQMDDVPESRVATPWNGAGKAQQAVRLLAEALRGAISRARMGRVDLDASKWLQQNPSLVLNAGDFARRETIVTKITVLLGGMPRGAAVAPAAEGRTERSLLQLVSAKLLHQAVGRGLMQAVESVRSLIVGTSTATPAEQLQPRQSVLGNLASVMAEVGSGKHTSEQALREGLRRTLGGSGQEVERLRDRATTLSVQSSAVEDFRKLLHTIQAQLRTPLSDGDRALLEFVKRLDNALARFEQQALSDVEASIRHTLRGALEELNALMKLSSPGEDAAHTLSPPFIRVARQLQAMLQVLTELPDEALLQSAQLVERGALSFSNLKGVVATAPDEELLTAVQQFERRVAEAGRNPLAVRAEARGILERVTRTLDGSKDPAAVGGEGTRSSALGVQLQEALGRGIKGELVSGLISDREGSRSAQLGAQGEPEGHVVTRLFGGEDVEAVGGDKVVNSAAALREYQKTGMLQGAAEGREPLQAWLRELARDPQSGQLIKLLVRLTGTELLSLSESDRGMVVDLQRLLAPIREEGDGAAQLSNPPKVEIKKALGELRDALALQRATEAISRTDNSARLSLERVRGILDGQRLLSQMAPVMQLKGEAIAILLPSFLGGMFGTVQIQKLIDNNEDAAASDDDSRTEREDNGREPYKRLRVALTLPTLGAIDISVAHRSTEITAQMSFGEHQSAAWMSARIGALEGTLRMMGYKKVAIQIPQNHAGPRLRGAVELPRISAAAII